MPTWDPGSPLRSWLRKTPRPSRVRVHTEDGEERIIELPADTRQRWKIVEESVLASRAASVECLDDKGAVLRAQRIELDDTGDAVPDYDKQRKSDERMQSKTRSEMAHFADAFGSQLNRAFDRGAAAANTGQENLVALVEVLTQHLSLAITNLHNVSVNLANMVAEAAGDGEGGNPNGKLLEQVIGAAAVRAVGAVGASAEHPNGKGKHK